MSLLQLPPEASAAEPEFFETLLAGQGALRVERIISHGHVTPNNEYYNQDEDEWVVVLKGSAVIAYDNGYIIRLNEGDTLFLPKHVRHRVEHTSSPCIWLAIFGTDLKQGKE